MKVGVMGCIVCVTVCVEMMMFITSGPGRRIVETRAVTRRPGRYDSDDAGRQLGRGLITGTPDRQRHGHVAASRGQKIY